MTTNEIEALQNKYNSKVNTFHIINNYAQFELFLKNSLIDAFNDGSSIYLEIPAHATRSGTWEHLTVR